MVFARVISCYFTPFITDRGQRAMPGVHGGKGSAAHKAAVTGDTVGDPNLDGVIGTETRVSKLLLGTKICFLFGCCMAQRRSLSGRSPFCQLFKPPGNENLSPPPKKYLKSYRNPIRKAEVCLPLPPFFRGKLAVKLRGYKPLLKTS